MLHLILIFTDTFRSLLRPASGYVTRIHIAYSNCPNCVSELDVTDNISNPPCGHKMSDYVVKTDKIMFDQIKLGVIYLYSN
jgi:hypothetical protein